jgi:hypothetical protein
MLEEVPELGGGDKNKGNLLIQGVCAQPNYDRF